MINLNISIQRFSILNTKWKQEIFSENVKFLTTILYSIEWKEEYFVNFHRLNFYFCMFSL